MAPWPEQGNELKSIDKIDEIRSPSFDDTQTQSKIENCEDKGKAGKLDDNQDPALGCLDEGQLKALLDEAITYRKPKDREGKSELFKELLQEVEADEKEDISLKNQINSSTNNIRFNRNRRTQHTSSGSGGNSRLISERQRSGGSLQNLVLAYSHELEASQNKRRNKNNLKGSNNNVSARQREGGSLPSNVNHVQGSSSGSNSFLEEYKRRKDMPAINDDKPSSESGLCTDYSSSSNNCNSRKTSSNWGDEDGIELQDMFGNGNTASSRTYTSRATLELCNTSDTNDSGHTLIQSGDQNAAGVDIDTSILFPLKHKGTSSSDTSSLSMNTNYTTVRCLTSPDSMAKEKDTTKNESSSNNIVSTLSIPPQRISASTSEDGTTVTTTPTTTTTDLQFINGSQVSMFLSNSGEYPGSKIIHLASGGAFDLFSEPLYPHFTSTLDKSKTYDENGNTLGHTERKKARRAKAKNEKNTYLAETVDGFLGDKDINELLMFIENDGGQKKKGKVTQQKQKKTKDDSDQPKKRKGKGNLTKCNSLEEISKTKLEDLTSSSTNNRLRPKKQVTLDDNQLRWHEVESNSISADEASLGRKRKDSSRDKEKDKERKTEDESEFRLVQTKKHRRRKRRSSHNEQMDQSHVYTRHSSPDRRNTHHHHRHRTSSMPPSDQSDCSDLDSVHSLPITSVRERRSNDYNSSSRNNNNTNSNNTNNNNNTNSNLESNNNNNNNNNNNSNLNKTNNNSCNSSNNSIYENALSSHHELIQTTPPTTTNDNFIVVGSGGGANHKQQNQQQRNHNNKDNSNNSAVFNNNNSPQLIINNNDNNSSKHNNNNSNVNNNNKLVNLNGSISNDNSELCNGSIEEYESITLPLNNNNTKHKHNNMMNGSVDRSSVDCDVFVEFNLPAPPSSNNNNNLSNHVDVTVEKTVIIRNQQSTGISESISLIIPQPLPPLPSSPLLCNTTSTNTNFSSNNTLTTTTTSVIPPPTSRKTRTTSSSSSNCSQPAPPVILMTDIKEQLINNIQQDNDITFGFEINNKLLLKQKESNSLKPVMVTQSTTLSNNNIKTVTVTESVVKYNNDNDVSSSKESITLKDNFNYYDIVNYIAKSWKDVMKDYSNQKHHHQQQEDPIRINYYTAPS